MSILFQRDAASDRALGAFWLGGSCSRDYGIILASPPPKIFAERDVEKTSVAGRSGDLIRDNGRYKNIQIPYKCTLIPNAWESYRDAAERAVQILAPTAGYQRLTNVYEPWCYQMARISAGISIESLVEQAGAFEIQFDCKPQRYLFSGEIPITFTAPGELYNDYSPALPLIKVIGAGDSTLTIGGILVQIYGQTEPIFLDCDLQNAYRETAEGIKENRNNQISAPVFPVLHPGTNVVTWTGGITSLEITPRWWTI